MCYCQMVTAATWVLLSEGCYCHMAATAHIGPTAHMGDTAHRSVVAKQTNFTYSTGHSKQLTIKQIHLGFTVHPQSI